MKKPSIKTWRKIFWSTYAIALPVYTASYPDAGSIDWLIFLFPVLVWWSTFKLKEKTRWFIFSWALITAFLAAFGGVLSDHRYWCTGDDWISYVTSEAYFETYYPAYCGIKNLFINAALALTIAFVPTSIVGTIILFIWRSKDKN